MLLSNDMINTSEKTITLRVPIFTPNAVRRISLVAALTFASGVFSCSDEGESEGEDSGLVSTSRNATGGFNGDINSSTASSNGGAPPTQTAMVISGGILEGVNGLPPGGDQSSSISLVLPDDACAGEVYEGESLPLNMLVMMDRSVSMGDGKPIFLIAGTNRLKWDEARKGFEQFVALPSSAGIGMGIDYFGQKGSCDQLDYSTPEVDITPLPGVAPAILASYNEWSPGQGTPLGPALEGAITAAKKFRAKNVASQTIVVLVTDGVPNGCGAIPSPSDVMRQGVDNIAKIAAAGLADGVATWVLGIRGQEVVDADFNYTTTEIAKAGGGDAVVIAADDNLADKFSGALDKIRGSSALPCDFTVPLPPGDAALDLAKVNIALTPDGKEPEPILNVSGAEQCEYGGWYYDPPVNPTSLKLCPTTCEVVSSISGAGFQVFFGCDTASVTIVR